MYPTVEFLTHRYIDFNRQMFGSKLPLIKLKVTSGRQRLGCFKRKEFLDFSRKNVLRVEYTITVSGVFDLPAEMIEDILIHEMIHFKVALSGVQEPSHGPSFITTMNDINGRFNRNVKVKLDLPQDATALDTRLTRNFIFTFIYQGKEYFTRAAGTCLFSIYRDMFANPYVSDVKIYGTMDPLFERYRRSRSLKGYDMNDEVRRSLDESGTELEIVGNECRPK